MLWVLFDLAFAGDPLHSLTGTRDTVEELDRDTGLAGLVIDGRSDSARLLREPVLLGAAGGIALRWRAAPPSGAIGLAARCSRCAAFALLALAGLAV